MQWGSFGARRFYGGSKCISSIPPPFSWFLSYHSCWKSPWWRSPWWMNNCSGVVAVSSKHASCASAAVLASALRSPCSDVVTTLKSFKQWWWKVWTILPDLGCVWWWRWCRASCPRMSVDILGTNCDQCLRMVQCCFTSTETVRRIRTERPGRPPRLSHSSWTLCVLDEAYLRLCGTVRVHRPNTVRFGWGSSDAFPQAPLELRRLKQMGN